MLEEFFHELHVDAAIRVDLEEECIVCSFQGTKRAAASADTHLSVSGHFCCAPALVHWPRALLPHCRRTHNSAFGLLISSVSRTQKTTATGLCRLKTIRCDLSRMQSPPQR